MQTNPQSRGHHRASDVRYRSKLGGGRVRAVSAGCQACRQGCASWTNVVPASTTSVARDPRMERFQWRRARIPALPRLVEPRGIHQDVPLHDIPHGPSGPRCDRLALRGRRCGDRRLRPDRLARARPVDSADRRAQCATDVADHSPRPERRPQQPADRRASWSTSTRPTSTTSTPSSMTRPARSSVPAPASRRRHVGPLEHIVIDAIDADTLKPDLGRLAPGRGHRRRGRQGRRRLLP